MKKMRATLSRAKKPTTMMTSMKMIIRVVAAAVVLSRMVPHQRGKDQPRMIQMATAKVRTTMMRGHQSDSTSVIVLLSQ
ncbi:hypothetical protein MUK42_05212 [Musa troglodytarum]|uniref:Uncharacterized protein n=1 Tax=Musa troglodytarum TaxID=320322 RepID=A0A9E7ESS4_9LILI|nr:hypothetical protein MUK42_05212 [Musa troglodytarum]